MEQYLALVPWGVILVVFVGMASLLWKAMSALHEQAKLLTQLVGQVSAGGKALPALPATLPGSPLIIKPLPVPPSPSPPVVVDQGLVDFIKKEEGFKTKAYWDYKQYSIGYGTKANSSTEVIDQAEAERRLAAEVAKAAHLVESFCPTAPLGVKQALTDLTYNSGEGWEARGLGELIKAGNYAEAKDRILEYNHAGGEVNTGLTARRKAETSWFDHPL